MIRTNRRVLRLDVDRLEERCLLSAGVLSGGYFPAQVKAAYGLNAINFTSQSGQTIAGDATGETIALVVAYHDPNLAADLHAFDAGFGLADPTLTQVNLAGPTNTNDAWAGEETLDVEWAHAIAPGATIVVVEAISDSTDNLLAAVNVARFTPGVVAVSMSWSGPEIANERSYDSFFTTPSGHAGITFVAATGDTGASGGAQWPAASPNVLSVGGTSLAINAANGYGGESAWSGSGSGLSRYEAEPTYQRGIQSSGRRSVPDVAFLADPNTGVVVYSTNPSNNAGGWQVVGGTSLGTPAWAGIVAIIDQGLALAGKGSLDGATQLIPRLYALIASDFHTVGIASNNLIARGLSNFAATTGLGTPVGQAIITEIVHPTTAPAQGTATTDATAHASGSTTFFGADGLTMTTTGGTTPTGHAKAPVKGKKHAKPAPKPHSHSGQTTKLVHQLATAAVKAVPAVASAVAHSASLIFNTPTAMTLVAPAIIHASAPLLPLLRFPSLSESLEAAIQDFANDLF